MLASGTPAGALRRILRAASDMSDHTLPTGLVGALSPTRKAVVRAVQSVTSSMGSSDDTFLIAFTSPLRMT